MSISLRDPSCGLVSALGFWLAWKVRTGNSDELLCVCSMFHAKNMYSKMSLDEAEATATATLTCPRSGLTWWSNILPYSILHTSINHPRALLHSTAPQNFNGKLGKLGRSHGSNIFSWQGVHPHPILSNSIQSHPVPSSPIQSNPTHFQCHSVKIHIVDAKHG